MHKIICFVCFFILQSLMMAQVSRFDHDSEKWYANEDAVGNVVIFDKNFGNPAPSIYADDSNTGLPWYFVAPDCFLGDRSYAYGDSLKFDFFVRVVNSTSYTDDIRITGANGQVIVQNLPRLPNSNAWTNFAVPLHETAWHKGDSNGAITSLDEFMAVLKNIASLEIRGEYLHGADRAWLDNVWLGDIPYADISAQICQGEVLQVGKYQHTETGIFLDELEYPNGCDSLLVKVDLVVYPKFEQKEVLEVCAGTPVLLPDGSETYQSGIWIYRNKTEYGCDSNHVVQVISHPPSDTLLEVILPENTPFLLPDGTWVRDTNIEKIFTLRSELGCDSLVTLRLQYIFYKVFAPNIFSPNGDGQNDYFTLYTNDNAVAIKYLNIYDRWGEQLFSTKTIAPNEPLLGWDGQFRGRPAMPGIYIYSAEILFEDGTSLPYQGDLMLIR